MKVYIAARYERREEMLRLARRISRLGHEVTSRWIEGHGKDDAESALYDLTDIVVADALVLFTEDPIAQVPFAARGGRHVEFGYALRAGKKLFLVGPRENVFHDLPDVQRFDNKEAFLDHLAATALDAKEELAA